MTSRTAALVFLSRRYLDGLMDPFVSVVEAQQLLYFAQEAGEPLRVRFVKRPKGPLAENFDEVVQAAEGHLVSTYREGGSGCPPAFELLPGAVESADSFLRLHPETRTRLNLVAGLIDGFESSFGLELLSTVHWVVVHESVTNPDELVGRTYAWHERKARFAPRQVSLAFETLTRHGWLTP